MKKINRKGIIMELALIIMLVCTVLGFTLINLSGTNSIEALNAVRSRQAFWLAEAGISSAIDALPATDTPGDTLGSGSYDLTITPVPDTSDRWTIQSTGTVTVGNITRTVEVTVFAAVEYLSFAVGTAGDFDIAENSGDDIDGEITGGVVLIFDDVFGMTKEQMMTYPGTELITGHAAKNNPTNPDGSPIDGITWVQPDEDVTCTIGATVWEGSGILVVDGNLNISGGTFTGILWVSGDLSISSITGNPIITGAIYMEGTGTTHIRGTPTITYDATLIFNELGSVTTPVMVYEIISWQEIS